MSNIGIFVAVLNSTEELEQKLDDLNTKGFIDLVSFTEICSSDYSAHHVYRIVFQENLKREKDLGSSFSHRTGLFSKGARAHIINLIEQMDGVEVCCAAKFAQEALKLQRKEEVRYKTDPLAFIEDSSSAFMELNPVVAKKKDLGRSAASKARERKKEVLRGNKKTLRELVGGGVKLPKASPDSVEAHKAIRSARNRILMVAQNKVRIADRIKARIARVREEATLQHGSSDMVLKRS